MIVNTLHCKLLFLALLFGFVVQPSFAQKEISNFHYSNTGITYNSGNPQTIPGIPTPNSEWSIATISDSIGNVLFDFSYTNPTVWPRKGVVFDKNYQVMPGSNLFGPHYYYGSTALVAPVPSNNSKYYLFYQVSQQFSSSARWVLKYAVIDMSLNGGLGNVISADNPIDTTNAYQLLTPFTLVQQRGSDNFWVVTCKANSDTLISLKDFIHTDLNSYKKKAIEVAVGQATGELIVTTDADCFVKENWLQTLAAFYEEHQPAFIAAPVSIDCSNKFIEFFQGLDFMTLQGITGASVHKKIHSMCNGANLAYTKKAFEEVGGFTGIDTIASGDDMLLMHKIYKRYPGKVMFLKSKDVIVHTAPVNSIREFFNQRIRWASKADKYDDNRIFAVLLLVYFVNLLLLILPVIALIQNVQYSIFNIQYSIWCLWLFLLLVKTIAELVFLYPVAKFFGKQSMLWMFPLMQPFHIIYTVIAGWLGKFGSYSWKERKVK